MKKDYYNSGEGAVLQPIDIGHRKYACVIEPESAFWALVDKNSPGDFLFRKNKSFDRFMKKRKSFLSEMKRLRYNRLPQAVYLNPTEKCNLNCTYCYIPEPLRKNGTTLSRRKLFEALDILKKYFKSVLPGGRKGEIIFHGSEPLISRDNVFAAISRYKKNFQFGIQTNGSLLDKDSIEFIISNNVNIGLSLDGHIPEITRRTRKTWGGRGIHRKVIDALRQFNGYRRINVICTVTRQNVRHLPEIVDYFHSKEVGVGMLNTVRCTQKGGLMEKPSDKLMAEYFMKALDRSYKLYKKTGRKIVIANFANILVSILAPTARKLMCDISPCGGGRCFFAVSAKGDIFPCSEFIGLKQFRGGNIFKGGVEKSLNSTAFTGVTERKIEDITPCANCAIRHFCGSPCPAEAFTMNGHINSRGAFCHFYEEQVRYALRLIADNKHNDYLWDNWDRDTSVSY